MDEVQFDFHDPKQKEMFLYLLKMKKINANKALMHAIEHGDLDIVKALVETGDCDLNYSLYSEPPYDCKHCCQKLDYNASLHETPLFIAIMYRDTDMLMYLVSLDDCDVNKKNKDGNTPLMFAICRENLTLVEILLSTGKCDVNVKNQEGCTALMFAVCINRPDMVKLLLDTGNCDFNVQDQKGHTCLMYMFNYQDIDYKLLKSDYDEPISSEDIDSESISSFNSEHERRNESEDEKQLEIFKLILGAGKCDLDLKNQDGNSFLDFTHWNKKIDELVTKKSF